METDVASFESQRRAMVDRQVRPSDVTRLDLVDALLAVPRELYVPKARRAQAYIGEHLEVGPGRVELDPRIFAKMLNAAEPRASDVALVIGGGRGYAAAVLARLTAAVVTLEADPEMARAAAEAVEKHGLDSVIAREGPLAAGWPGNAPYNLVLVNGAMARDVPAAIVAQLAPGGRLVRLVREGAIGRCELAVESGGALGAFPSFDAVAPVLPGFEAEARFEF